MQGFVNEYVLDREGREAVEDHMDYLDGRGYWPGVIRRKLKMARRKKDQAVQGTNIRKTVTIHLVS
ncbi:MAG TPA: hypothetical protein VJZ03_03155 [Candidatus Bathyarchaeia archaeon]|nr:hypothetical protein [Candidatus Bathyarchaeia archaeon]